MKFTPEELEETRRADEETEREFHWTNEELTAPRARYAKIALENEDLKRRRAAEKQRAYYKANRESIAEKRRAYREANKGRSARI